MERKTQWLTVLEQMDCISESTIVCPSKYGLLTVVFTKQNLFIVKGENRYWGSLQTVEKANVRGNVVFWTEHNDSEKLLNKKTFEEEGTFQQTDKIFCLIDDIEHVKLSNGKGLLFPLECGCLTSESDKIEPGSSVVAQFEGEADEGTYHIPSDYEACLVKWKWAVDSALAKAMMGKGIGDEFEFQGRESVRKGRILRFS